MISAGYHHRPAGGFDKCLKVADHLPHGTDRAIRTVPAPRRVVARRQYAPGPVSDATRPALGGPLSIHPSNQRPAATQAASGVFSTMPTTTTICGHCGARTDHGHNICETCRIPPVPRLSALAALEQTRSEEHTSDLRSLMRITYGV